MTSIKNAVLSLPLVLIVSASALGVQFHAQNSGDWSSQTWYTDNSYTVMQAGTPGVGDDIFIQNGNTVSYDIAGTATYNSITVSNASTFGYKLNTSVNDIREIRLTGDLSMPGNVHDHSYIHIGGTFGGSSIESGDSLKLIFDTNGAGINMSGARSRLFVGGLSATNRNVEIAGAGGGINAVVNSAAGRLGASFDHVNFHDYSQFTLGGGTEGGSRSVSGSNFNNTAAAEAITGGSNIVYDNNNITTTGNGIFNGDGSIIQNNTITRSGGVGGRGIDLNVHGDKNNHYESNSISGFDRGLFSQSRSDITMTNNNFDGNNYGLYWLASGGSGSTSFQSVGDQFGTLTPNSVYDVYIASLGLPTFMHFDGSILGSDANPLNELYYEFNNSNQNYIAFRDFNGVDGDYRIWSSDDGLQWSDLIFLPDSSDTLTLESDSAFSNATPTTLSLTEDLQLQGIVLDPTTSLDLMGSSLTLFSFSDTDGTPFSTAGFYTDNSSGAFDGVTFNGGGIGFWLRLPHPSPNQGV